VKLLGLPDERVDYRALLGQDAPDELLLEDEGFLRVAPRRRLSACLGEKLVYCDAVLSFVARLKT
jgi:hypothetical protein